MPFFKNVFKSKDGARSASRAAQYQQAVAPPKPQWQESWERKDVSPDEVQELIHLCTQEIKSRALDYPFLLLPFRPTSDQSAARNFVRNFFKASYEGTRQFTGEGLQQELRLTEPLVLCSIIKWCWSRLPGGVVTWDAYELFRIGESDSNFAKHAFDTFIPLSVESDARRQIIVDFFELLAAVAARGKSNGMGGRKLSRMAGWWAFEFADEGKGFDGGYRTWEKAADAASHLFFAYLRSLWPDPDVVGKIETLPRSLQALLQQTEYPPEPPVLMQTTTTKVVMIVDSVSPTPFSLLRRAKHFEYRDDDETLVQFSSFEDPVRALTDECRRVLECIATANQSVTAVEGVRQEPSWSRFEDFGFSDLLDQPASPSANGGTREFSAMKTSGRSRTNDFGRPTTPSWADFLSSGFADDSNGRPAAPPLLLPPDKVLPPLGDGARVHSSQSHMRHGLTSADDDLEPGELASITQFDLDETFWWVWMTSLASEEPTERKAVFGRCTLIETRIGGGRWLVMEEQIKGAAAGPEEGAYIAEKKGRFSFRTRLGRRKSTGKKPTKELYNRNAANTPMSKSSIAPDQQARVQAAAARLAQKQKEDQVAAEAKERRGRRDESASMKTNSVLTLQPHLLTDAAAAMKWDKKFGEGAQDRDAIRAQYLGNVNAGKGSQQNLAAAANGTKPPMTRELSNRDLPSLPKADAEPTSPDKGPVPTSPVQLPPAPAPAPPVAASQKAEAQSAARAPLPAKSGSLLPSAIDEKPVPTDQLDTHPAFRKPIPERKPMVSPQQNSALQGQSKGVAAAVQKFEAVQRSPPKKLKKATTGSSAASTGGFRKLFGKKKTDATDESGRSLSVSQAPASQSGRYTPQPERAPSPYVERAPSPYVEPAPAYTAPPPAPEPVRAESPAMEPSPAVSAVAQDYREPAYGRDPRADVHERQADPHNFSNFTQGPMDDMPAFVPEISDDGELTPSAPTHPVHPSAYDQREATPTGAAPAQNRDSISEASLDMGYSMSPSQDRWAQIRRNAAERAARLSEEQRSRSQSQSHSAATDATDETSGEETIESRVARIKARVAELTGNVDGQPPRY